MARQVKAEIINWEIHHPDGHTYILPNLDHFFAVHDKSKEEMQKLGWKFIPRSAQ